MRILAALTALALVAALGGGNPQAQDLTTDVFPSEDELYQALLTGDISYRQYLILQEISQHGLDSTNIHLLDEIPNLSFFGLDSLALETSLENEQKTPFESGPTPPKSRKIAYRARHRFDSYLDDDGRSRYRSSLSLDVGSNLTADIKLRREYSGYERITDRSLSYRNRRGVLRELTAGNFSKRLGMGTVFGYRGKLLDYSDDIDTESWMYPDNGAANGLSVRLASGGWDSNLLLSLNRDDNFRLTSAAARVGLSRIPLNPALLLSLNHLKNRIIGSSIADFKYGVDVRHNYSGGYAAMEAVGQAGEQPSFGAFVTEGRHRFKTAEIRYAGWTYDNDYIDLTGGSKASAIYHEKTIEPIGFEYSTKRAGQSGGMLKTIVELDGNVQLANSVIYAAFNSDTANIQWLTQLTRSFHDLSLGLDFLTRHKRRHRAGDDLERTARKTRLTLRMETGNFRIRTYVGYNTGTSRPDYMSLFFTVRHNHEQFGRLELWSNIAEIDHHKGKVEYWYAYVRHGFTAVGNLTAAVKLTHAYRRGATEEHRSTVSFDLSYAY